MAASTAGAFVVGVNRRSTERDWFTGVSWIYSPTGELLGESSPEQPFVTVETNTDETLPAKNEYPLTMYGHYRSP